MGDLKREYPEGCRLDLWEKVVKAKYINEELILDSNFCILESEIGGKITSIEDIRIKVLNTNYSFNMNSVYISIDYKIVLFVVVDGQIRVVSLTNTYQQTIKLDKFDPPLTVDEFRTEIDHAEIIIKNWIPDGDIIGDCADLTDPSFFSPVPGTLITIKLLACIIVKLDKMHDIIVYGELDPDC